MIVVFGDKRVWVERHLIFVDVCLLCLQGQTELGTKITQDYKRKSYSKMFNQIGEIHFFVLK